MQFLENLNTAASAVPDSVKVASATTPTVMTIAGIPVEQWMFVASFIVSVMFIVEKVPVIITRIKQLVNWIKTLRSRRDENVKRKKP